jgi:hypothetical protein
MTIATRSIKADDLHPQPQQTELTVSFSAGAKVQIVKYELSGDVHLSRTEKYNVEGLTPDEIDAFYQERYEALSKEIGDKVVAEADEMTQSS